MFPDKIYYEPDSINYALGKMLQQKFADASWIPIENHNNIPELRQRPNADFAKMKRYLVIGTRKTHKYTENHKISDFLVPYTSSGCSAMCLYCYLVCNYNKCSYLRLFVNREQMLEKLMRTAQKSQTSLTFEIGSNSDLVLENTITGNLVWTIEEFAKSEKGKITFPTKFDMVSPLLNLNHQGKVIFRMSVNPDQIIRQTEFGTSNLQARISALNQMADAGYQPGLLIAPVILVEEYEKLYSGLIDTLAETLSEKVKKNAAIEIIFMTYSFVHQAINTEAFPNARQLYDTTKMAGSGMGKYRYRKPETEKAERFLRQQIAEKLKMPILYIA